MIYSRNAFSAAGEVGTVCVEHLQGAPLSFMTTIAALRMQSLTEPAVVIPTTTRTVEQFHRIRLPGAPSGVRYSVDQNVAAVAGYRVTPWRAG